MSTSPFLSAAELPPRPDPHTGEPRPPRAPKYSKPEKPPKQRDRDSCSHRTPSTPRLLDRSWWAPHERITEVGRQKKNIRDLFGGGLRDRLKIELQDGSTELFVINKLNEVIEQIRIAAQRS